MHMRAEADAEAVRETCYLCGHAMLPGEATNVDHIPPKQTMTPGLRRKYAPVRLVTRRVHSACNLSYEMDERYFVQNLVPYLRGGNEPATALYRKTIEEYHAGMNVGLVNRIKGQWTNKVGNILLPASTMAYQFEGDRFYRVADKIVRGLHYVETGYVLPQDVKIVWDITFPRSNPPQHFELFMLDPRRRRARVITKVYSPIGTGRRIPGGTIGRCCSGTRSSSWQSFLWARDSRLTRRRCECSPACCRCSPSPLASRQ